MNFIDTYLRPLQTFSLLVAYWQALEKTCSKHVPWKFPSKPKTSHLTTTLKTLTIVFKFEPSFLTYAKSYFWSHIHPKDYSNVCHVVSKASNNLKVTCFVFQSNPKTFITRAKTSWTPSNIQRSKLVMVE